MIRFACPRRTAAELVGKKGRLASCMIEQGRRAFGKIAIQSHSHQCNASLSGIDWIEDNGIHFGVHINRGSHTIINDSVTITQEAVINGDFWFEAKVRILKKEVMIIRTMR